MSSEEAAFLQLGQADLSLDGLLLAGIVIGALGVLDDVTISQASTVLALRHANPSLGFRELFGRALQVGRDHVSATGSTLVLAYMGAALPILLLFSATELGVSDAVNFEIVAKEIVATLVGSIGLIAAVPDHHRARRRARAGRAAGAATEDRRGARALARPKPSQPLDVEVAVGVADRCPPARWLDCLGCGSSC